MCNANGNALGIVSALPEPAQHGQRWAVTAGGGFIWTWPVDSPLILPVSAALQITNANASGATTGTFAAYVVWEE